MQLICELTLISAQHKIIIHTIHIQGYQMLLLNLSSLSHFTNVYSYHQLRFWSPPDHCITRIHHKQPSS